IWQSARRQSQAGSKKPPAGITAIVAVPRRVDKHHYMLPHSSLFVEHGDFRVLAWTRADRSIGGITPQKRYACHSRAHNAAFLSPLPGLGSTKGDEGSDTSITR